MKIKQSVINTFNRVGIKYDEFDNTEKDITVYNRFGGGSCETTELIAFLVDWVYSTSNDYERGINKVKISDFDRVRYFILDADSNVYTTCID